MSATSTPRQTDTAHFLADMLDFISERIAEAVADPSSQLAAIEEAAGAIPAMHDRLRHHDVIWTNFFLVLGIKIERDHWRRWWTAFSEMDRDEFLREAAELTRPDGAFPVLKSVLAHRTSSDPPCSPV